jgi:hypothetical protein
LQHNPVDQDRPKGPSGKLATLEVSRTSKGATAMAFYKFAFNVRVSSRGVFEYFKNKTVYGIGDDEDHAWRNAIHSERRRSAYHDCRWDPEKTSATLLEE